MSAIDPGVDEGIQQRANEVESDESESLTKEEEEDFLQPSRWWFASTACPLLAGTFGPMASGFNVCSLSTYWRQSIPPHGYEHWGKTIPDPPWVLAINTISLFSALVGNATLLLNMARRVKFSIAQPMTITGFLLAGVLLIADMAALVSSSDYRISQPEFQPAARHALTSAFYFAIFASAIYIIIGLLMCVTVYGANKQHYKKEFQLTASQRTLMLQTMSFMFYLLLGALVYSVIEGWEYLDAVYWADTTLLTVGLGDFSPITNVGKGLLFPFAIGGILIVGLVVGSIRSLILERGKQKLAARIVEKGREKAVRNVDEQKQEVKISPLVRMSFSNDPSLSPAQQREEEFRVMRKVQDVAEKERRYFALATSSTFALILWFVGAVIFMESEYLQGWTYFEALYFSYTSLMTIGYGDYAPKSNSGRAFFVLWTLLAVPSLTILISNMGDTIVKWVADLTNWLGSITVLPERRGVRATLRYHVANISKWFRDSFNGFTPPGIFGNAPKSNEKRMTNTEYENKMLDRLAGRLAKHVDKNELNESQPIHDQSDSLQTDIQFYHYVLARECRNLQKDLTASPPKKYPWADWEYYLKLMGNEDDPEDFPGQRNPDVLVPEQLRAPHGLLPNARRASEVRDRALTTDRYFARPYSSDGSDDPSPDEPHNPPQVDGNVDRRTSVARNLEARRKESSQDADSQYRQDWSWLSDVSPLMSTKTEAEWILERLSVALERELNRSRKGYRRKPPISLKDVRRAASKEQEGSAEAAEHTAEDNNLERAAESQE